VPFVESLAGIEKLQSASLSSLRELKTLLEHYDTRDLPNNAEKWKSLKEWGLQKSFARWLASKNLGPIGNFILVSSVACTAWSSQSSELTII
jgi:hypothetical protein